MLICIRWIRWLCKGLLCGSTDVDGIGGVLEAELWYDFANVRGAFTKSLLR